MLSLEDLQAALNDPTSPMREKLLQHLSMSPLDPALAYQELLKSENPAAGGLPTPITNAPPESGFADLMNPKQDLSREANPMGVVNLANSAEVLPTAGIMPGESGGMPDAGFDLESAKRMFEGLGTGGTQRQVQQQFPAVVAPKGNNWNTFNAAQLQTPAVARPLSLAEILRGGR